MNNSIDMSKFTPSAEEAKDGMITKNAVRCKICGANADRYRFCFRCQKNVGHIADPVVCIWSDLNYYSDELKEIAKICHASVV